MEQVNSAIGGTTTVEVKVQPDHIQRIAEGKSAVQAVAEMIWNALDGDASTVEVKIVTNDLTGIEEIQVIDDGHGIPYDLALTSFENLGASWKKGQTSEEGRRLHGQTGQGRFCAYSLGALVRWKTRYRKEDRVYAYEITGTDFDPKKFKISPRVISKNKNTGTEVIINNPRKTLRSLLADDAFLRFTEVFALYLRQYPSVKIRYNGRLLDPGAVQVHVVEYDLEPATFQDGRTIQGKLTIIEWKHKVERELVFCDGAGFALHSIPPGIQARGFDFTAYLKTDYFRELHDNRLLVLEELLPDSVKLVEAAKDTMRAHFRRRLAEDARNIVDQWKADEIYPYEGQPRNIVEQVERQVFDVVALNVNEYLPEFSASDLKSKKFSLHMLKAAIEKSPAEARRIIQHVLELPKEKQEELSALLEKTSLEAIINASKLIIDRLEFLTGLEVILFSYEGKNKLKERQHLHRIIAENTWIFGEEFHLSVDDQSLTEVLRKHLAILDKDRTELAPVKTLEGGTGIVDLMLSKKIPQPRRDQIEHLVIELKRPSQDITSEVTTQIEKYAFAVAEDERFKGTPTRWIFWAVSNDMDKHTRRKTTNQKNRPDGILHEAEDQNITIWVKTWAQIIEACRARLAFFQEGLNYMATQDAGLSYVQELYSKYLPDELKAERAGE
ncbi:MAG: DNA mismatch repair protein [Myxococcales bacterium]|nr:MAG: DNA mismatch repair protein [Myxococcales bacterium]